VVGRVLAVAWSLFFVPYVRGYICLFLTVPRYLNRRCETKSVLTLIWLDYWFAVDSGGSEGVGTFGLPVIDII